MRILLIDNGFTVEMSGGDYHMIRVSHQWSISNEVCFLLPRLGYNYVGKLLCGKVFVYDTPLEDHSNDGAKTIILYVMRMLRVFFWGVRNQFDIFIASSHYPHDVIPAVLFHLRNSKSKLAVYVHGTSIPVNKPLISLISRVYNTIGLLLSMKFANLIFVINNPTRTHLLHLGAKSEKIATTSNGIEPNEFVSSKRNKVVDACFLGRLVKSKGILDLPFIWKEVCTVRPNARLTILGDGPEKGVLRKLVAEAGLGKNITLFGFVFGEEKYRRLESSEIFVFPSYLESWGISIAEAMTCGLPVVAYNLSVYKEVFQDELVTVPLGEVDAMAKQVIFLLENPDVAKKIGEKGREFVKRYDWNRVAEQELSAIINLVSKQRG